MPMTHDDNKNDMTMPTPIHPAGGNDQAAAFIGEVDAPDVKTQSIPACIPTTRNVPAEHDQSDMLDSNSHTLPKQDMSLLQQDEPATIGPVHNDSEGLMLNHDDYDKENGNALERPGDTDDIKMTHVNDDQDPETNVNTSLRDVVNRQASLNLDSQEPATTDFSASVTKQSDEVGEQGATDKVITHTANNASATGPIQETAATAVEEEEDEIEEGEAFSDEITSPVKPPLDLTSRGDQNSSEQASTRKDDTGILLDGTSSLFKLYIGGLPEKAEIDDVKDCFGQFGKIAHIEFRVGYAFIEYTTAEAAKEAIDTYHEGHFLGKMIRVEATKSATAQKAAIEQGTCFTCGEAGHFAKQCPKDPRNARRAQRDGGGRPPRRNPRDRSPPYSDGRRDFRDRDRDRDRDRTRFRGRDNDRDRDRDRDRDIDRERERERERDRFRNREADMRPRRRDDGNIRDRDVRGYVERESRPERALSRGEAHFADERNGAISRLRTANNNDFDRGEVPWYDGYNHSRVTDRHYEPEDRARDRQGPQSNNRDGHIQDQMFTNLAPQPRSANHDTYPVPYPQADRPPDGNYSTRVPYQSATQHMPDPAADPRAWAHPPQAGGSQGYTRLNERSYELAPSDRRDTLLRETGPSNPSDPRLQSRWNNERDARSDAARAFESFPQPGHAYPPNTTPQESQGPLHDPRRPPPSHVRDSIGWPIIPSAYTPLNGDESGSGGRPGLQYGSRPNYPDPRLVQQSRENMGAWADGRPTNNLTDERPIAHHGGHDNTYRQASTYRPRYQ